MNIQRIILSTLGAVLSLGFLTGAFTGYLKIEGVDGESVKQKPAGANSAAPNFFEIPFTAIKDDGATLSSTRCQCRAAL